MALSWKNSDKEARAKWKINKWTARCSLHPLPRLLSCLHLPTGCLRRRCSTIMKKEVGTLGRRPDWGSLGKWLVWCQFRSLKMIQPLPFCLPPLSIFSLTHPLTPPRGLPLRVSLLWLVGSSRTLGVNCLSPCLGVRLSPSSGTL